MGVSPCRFLVEGEASGPVLALDEPLSFWGGLDPGSGSVTDRRHPQHGRAISGSILVMAHGRGSSSASSVLAEAIRRGAGPAGIVMRHPDIIVALGAVVAGELYTTWIPVVVASDSLYDAVAAASWASIDVNGMRMSVR